MSQHLEDSKYVTPVLYIEDLQKMSLYQGPSASIYVGPDRILFTAPIALLSARSKFFAMALGGSFQEAQTHEISLPLYDPEAFKCILHWIFAGELGLSLFQRKAVDVSTHNVMYGKGGSLEQRATAVCWTLSRISFHAGTLLMDELFGHVDKLLRVLFGYMKRWGHKEWRLEADLVIEVFDNTPEGSSLRCVIVDQIVRHLTTEREDGGKMKPMVYNEAFMKIPGFAAEVFERLDKAAEVRAGDRTLESVLSSVRAEEYERGGL